jgi:hypothetical protein
LIIFPKSPEKFLLSSVAGCFIPDPDPRILSFRISDPGSYFLSKMRGSKIKLSFFFLLTVSGVPVSFKSSPVS